MLKINGKELIGKYFRCKVGCSSPIIIKVIDYHKGEVKIKFITKTSDNTTNFKFTENNIKANEILLDFLSHFEEIDVDTVIVECL